MSRGLHLSQLRFTPLNLKNRSIKPFFDCRYQEDYQEDYQAYYQSIYQGAKIRFSDVENSLDRLMCSKEKGYFSLVKAVRKPYNRRKTE